MDLNIWNEQLRARIVQICADKDISFRELSKELGYSSNYIQNIVSGKNQPSMTGLFELCIYFSITPSDFFSCFDSSESFHSEQISPIAPTKLQQELMTELLNVLNKKGIR